jgi:hypothetical protein
MKTLKKYRKVAWAIEHRKNCMLKSDGIVGVHLYSTKKAADIAIDLAKIEGKAVKVLITIERPNIYG